MGCEAYRNTASKWIAYALDGFWVRNGVRIVYKKLKLVRWGVVEKNS